MKKLLDLMASLSAHEIVPPRRDDVAPPQAPNEVSRTPAANCAIWNDIARALDIKPRGNK
jgi:hypothetical protein